MTYIVEYVWIGGKGEIRSKSRVIRNVISMFLTIENVPEWNYDGSSTWQADSEGDTEVILKPRALFNYPLENDTHSYRNYFVICDTYYANGEPTKSNTRVDAVNKFEKCLSLEPWFGLEQEYFFVDQSCEQYNIPHYCGNSAGIKNRHIVETHLRACITAGVRISGINAEVANGQWEFQIGPCEGISAADHLFAARFLLIRIAE